jgi:hypothetical protein
VTGSMLVEIDYPIEIKTEGNFKIITLAIFKDWFFGWVVR